MDKGVSAGYIARCQRELKKRNAPLEGWCCELVIDYETDNFQCELCGNTKVRYIHVMKHADYPDKIQTGCICAGVMEGDILAARERDAEMKRRSQRKSNYLKKLWYAASDDRWELEYKRKFMTIERDYFYGREFYKIDYDGDEYHWKDNRRMTSFLAAQHYVFEIMEGERERERIGT